MDKRPRTLLFAGLDMFEFLEPRCLLSFQNPA